MTSPIDKTAARNEGERRKDEALATLAAHREGIVTSGRRVLLHRLLIGGAATIDDVRDAVDVPPGVDPKAFGAVPGALARAGIIRAEGYERTCRPTAHARPVTRWALADRHKAEQWLVDHPPPFDVPTAQEKGDAAPTASPENLSPATNGETTDES